MRILAEARKRRVQPVATNFTADVLPHRTADDLPGVPAACTRTLSVLPHRRDAAGQGTDHGRLRP